MNPQEHYEIAQELLRTPPSRHHDEPLVRLAKAQVHATLALFPTEASALVLKPGDTIIARCAHHLTLEEADAVRHTFARYQVNAIVMDPEWDVVRDTASTNTESDRG